MSEPTKSDDAAQKPTGDDGQQPKPNAKDETKPKSDRDEELDKWKAQARKHQKDYEAVAKRLQEYEDRDKTDQQKQAEALARLKDENAELNKALLRMQVTSELGLPADLAELLVGDDKAAMVAVGKKLLALRNGTDGRKPSSRAAGLGSPAKTDKPLDGNDVLRLMQR